MLRLLLERSVTELLRAACLFALLGLAIMCASLVWPRALPVIFAMSVGQAIGIGAFSSYLLAVIVDVRRTTRERASQPAAPPPPGEADAGTDPANDR
ncbi:MAG TPA: hypothetical protein VHP33_40810 [Polyangiaceae bacterium]|nr:hypothetical protein [Polyangiaceae bacterium]